MTTSRFGQLLRRHRLAQQLTQGELARRAGLSLNAVNMLERGVRQRPHGHTAAVLADALGLQGIRRKEFMLVAPRFGESLAQIVDGLPDSERALLYRASVFAGDWSSAAAERVCSPLEGDRPIPSLLAALVDIGLLTADTRGAAPRFAMPPPVRELASMGLAASGEVGAVEQRHVQWCLNVAAAAEAASRRADVAALDRCTAEIENLGQAILRSAAIANGEIAALRLSAAIALLLGLHRGQLTAALVWLRGATSTQSTASTMPARSMALTRMSQVAFRLRDFRLAAECAADAARIQRRAGPRDWLPETIDSLGHAHWAHVNPAAGLPMFREEIELARASGDQFDLARGLRSAAAAVWRVAGARAAATLFRECMEVAERAGDRVHEVLALSGLGCVVAETGDLDGGRQLLAESVDRARALGIPSLTVRTLVRFGFVELLGPDGAEPARSLLQEPMATGRDVAPMWRRHAMVGLAVIATITGDERLARRLMIEVGRVDSDSMEWDPHTRLVIAPHAAHLNALSVS